MKQSRNVSPLVSLIAAGILSFVGVPLWAQGVTVTRTIAVGTNPQNVAMKPDGSEVYVSNLGGNTISVIGTTSSTVISTIAVGTQPNSLAVSPDGSRLYVGNAGGGVSVINTSTKSVINTIATSESGVQDMAITPDGTKLYVALGTGGLGRILTSNNSFAVVDTAICAEGTSVTPDGARLYVNYQCFGPGGTAGHDAVGVFNVASDTFITSITGLANVGNPGSRISPNGAQFWETGGDACVSIAYDHVGCPTSPGVPEAVVNVIQTSTNRLLRSLGFSTADSASGVVSFFPDGSRALVGGNNLKVIDTSSFATVGTIPIPSSGSVVFTPDGTHAYTPLPSQNTVAVLSTPVATTTTLTSSPNPSTYGQSVTLTAKVSPAAATGTVTFMDGSTNLGSPVTLSGGTAALNVSTLTAGGHSLTAVYGSDSNYATSTSSVLPQTVTKAVTTTTLTASPNPSIIGQSVTLTATISPSFCSGTMTFQDGSTPLGSSPLDGTADLRVSTLAAGGHSLTAVYSADANCATSTSPVLSQTVNKAATTTTLISSANVSTYGQNVTLTATVSPAAATGTVTFMDGSTKLGSPVTLSGGTAALNVSTLTAGGHSLTAVYGSDSNYATSTSSALSQTVNKAATTTMVTSSANPSTSGQSVTLTATVSPSTSTGTVTFQDGTTTLGSTVTLSGGTAGLTLSTLGVGRHSLTAVYSGDSNYLTSTSSNLFQTVNPPMTHPIPITEYPLSTPRAYGPDGIATGPDGALWFTTGPTTSGNTIGRITTTGAITEYPLPSSAPSIPSPGITLGPDGALWFSEGSNSNKIGRITASGTTTEYAIAPPSGGFVLGSVAVGPDGNLWYCASNPNRIGRLTTAGVFTDFPVPSQPSGITAGPDGAMWFTEYDGTTGKIGRITTSGTVTEYTIPTPSSNPIDITVGPDGALWFTEYNGNKIGRITTSGVITEYLVSSADGITKGPDGALWFAAPLSNRIGRITTDGTVTEYAVPTSGSGPVHLVTGPDNALWFTEIQGNKIGRAVVVTTTTTTLTASPNPSTYGQSVTLTATVSPSTASGTVTFQDGATTLGSSTLTGGTAVLSISTLVVGGHSLTAVYGGDSTYATSTSSILSQTINAIPPPPPPPPPPLLVSTTITTNPLGLQVIIDGTPLTAPQTFISIFGTSHTISVASPQVSGGTRSLFTKWSDGGEPTHAITAAASTTYTASFKTQYLLTTVVSPAGRGTVAATPTSPDGFYDSGTSVQLTATGSASSPFQSWSGDLSGSANPQSVVMNAPRSVTATFATVTTITTNPSGLQVVVDGTTLTTPQNFTWTTGSRHSIGIASPQGTGGTRSVFTNWSDSGAQTHTITAAAAPTTYTASFKTQYLLTTNIAGAGIVTASPASADHFYDSGTSVQLTAAGSANSLFQSWSGDLSGSANPQSVVMSAPRSVTASFVPPPPPPPPPLPELKFELSNTTLNPTQQVAVQLDLAAAYPLPITGQLIITFAPDATNNSDDPNVMFIATGAGDVPLVQILGPRTVGFTVPPNTPQFLLPNVMLQSGTVAGTITVTATSLQVEGKDMTPSPAPSLQMNVNRLVPNLTDNIRVVKTDSGFEVEISGYSTTREISQAIFRFSSTNGGNLQTSELTIDVTSAFTAWYQSAASAAMGSVFLYIQPFTVQGNINDIGSVAVTLVNSIGNSQTRIGGF